MKKTIVMIICMLGIFSACTKKDLPPPPTNTLSVTFKKDSSVSDITIQAPKNNQLIFQGLFNTGSINGFSLTSVSVKFIKIGDASMPNEYLKRIHLLCDGTFSGTPLSLIADSVNSNEFSFTNFATNFGQYKIGTIKISADILSNATNGTGLEDGLILEVQLTYTVYLGNNNPLSHFQTGVVVGHKTIFSTQPQPFTINSIADPSTPASGVLLHGQEKSVLKYGVKLGGTSGTVTEHRFLIQGQASGAVSAINLFDINGNFVGRANTSNGVAVITTGEALSLGLQKNYTAEAVVNVSSGAVSNYDFKIVLDEIKAYSSVTGEQKSDGTDRAGNWFTVRKTNFSIEKISISSQVINDSTEQDTYQMKVTNVGNFPGSFTQLSYGLTWANNSPNLIDTLELKPRVLINGFQPSGLWTDQGGDTVVANFFKESTNIITFTFDTEYSIAGGGSVIVMLKTFRKGFKHTNDGFRIRAIFDSSAIDPNYKFINKGTVGFSRKLFNTSTTTSAANSFKPLFIWSDQADPAHSPVPGLSSNDWMNGYGFASPTDQVWVK